MAGIKKPLSALEVSKITAPGLHMVGGVAGLGMQVVGRSRTWVLRILIGGKRRDMGLGAYPTVTLAKAYEAARAARAAVKAGIDPIAQGRAARSALAGDRASALTFEQCAHQYIEAKAPEWKNAKHAAQWQSTLATYAYPVIGKLLVRDVALPHILQILEPIWTKKTETATRLRGRIESVLDWATVRKYRTGDNPARWKGHLDTLLATPSKVARVVHHAALPYAQVGAFMAALRKLGGMGARALEFAILTAARSGEVRMATWSELDLGASAWTIPAGRMKAGKEHRVPLSGPARELLHALPRMEGVELVFPGAKGIALSDMTLTAVLKRMGVEVTAHGFRSTFRDWAGETTAYPREVIEHALAHQIPDAAEAAYARGTLFDKRRRLMEDWAKYCSVVASAASVTPIRPNA